MFKPRTAQIIIVCLVIIFLTSSCAMFNNGEQNQNLSTGLEQANKETRKINIGYKKHIAYIPFFVAMDKGFFSNNNLAVEPIIFESTNQMLGSLVAGQIDSVIGGANLPTILSLAEKSPDSLKIFSETKTSDDGLLTCAMTKKNSDINNLKNLKGKKVAVWPGGFSLIWLEDTLNTVGLKKSDIKEIVLESNLQLAALESGQVDALFTIEPLCTFGVNKGIGKIIYFNPLKNTTEIFAASVISNNFIANSGQATENIIKATEDAIEFMKNNPEESLAIIAKWTDYDEKLIKGIDIPKYSKQTEIDVEAIEDLAEKLYEKKLLENKIDINGLIVKKCW